MAPLFMAVIWHGSPYFEICVLICAIVAATELITISYGNWKRIWALTVLVLLSASYSALIFNQLLFAIGFALLASAVNWVISRAENRNRIWGGGGILYLALAVFAILEIRDWETGGRNWSIWLFSVVWATDIGAYFAGKIFGGVKLAPKISPGKTWTGTAGGLAAAAMTSAVFSEILFLKQDALILISIGIAVGIASQLGDLLESYFKRTNNVKDTGTLIPGHGGLLDRVDSVLLAAPITWLLVPAILESAN